MIVKKYMCALLVCLAMHAGAYAGQQRPDSAPTVPTQMPVEITPRAASDGAASKKLEHKKWKEAAKLVLGIIDFDYDVPEAENEEGDVNFLPQSYNKNGNIFADIETQQVDSQPSKTVSPEVSLPKFHAHRTDKSRTTHSDTTYYVKPRPIDGKGIVRDDNPSVELHGDKQRVDLYNKLGVRRTRVPSPSSRFPAEVFHQVGEVSKDFGPVPPVEEDALQFKLDL